MLAIITDNPPKPYKCCSHSNIVLEETKAQWLRKMSRDIQLATREPELHSFHEKKCTAETVQPDSFSPKWEPILLTSKVLCTSSTMLITV
jgi:hypothetical protein